MNAAQTIITLRQAEALLAFFGGHDAEVAIATHENGLVAWGVDCPEEGSFWLGATDVDDELADKGGHGDAQRARAARSVSGVALLAAEHSGMRVDYQGLFKQAHAALRRDPALAEMLRQFQDHVTELGRRWYAGDTAVVDELLQLYCVARETRSAIAAACTRLEGGK